MSLIFNMMYLILSYPNHADGGGGAATAAVFSTSNMMKFLRESRENGWKIIGTALREDSVPLSEISKVGEGGEVDNKEGIIVVLGNEGRGMRTNVIR